MTLRRAGGLSLWVLVLVLMGCNRKTATTILGRASASFAAERIPRGHGWQCWTGRCDRTCSAMPGPPMNNGITPEPACGRPTTAFCATYTLHDEPHWECFETRVSCEANQGSYLSEAKEGRDYSAVSPCTELP